MNDLQVFGFEGRNVRVVEKDGNPWWVLADVCEILGIVNVSNVCDRLDDDEKNTLRLMEGISTDGTGNPNATVINESGLYSVIIRSDKPDAKRFRKWVTSEVLPSIRKTGSYGMSDDFTLPSASKMREIRMFLKMGVIEKTEARKALFQPAKKPIIRNDTPVQTPILPIIPALDTFLSLPEFFGWREKLDENPGYFEKMGVKVIRKAGREELAIDHNHKILLRAVGRDYKARLKTDPRYIETRQVHIAHSQVSALIFGWKAVCAQ